MNRYALTLLFLTIVVGCSGGGGTGIPGGTVASPGTPVPSASPTVAPAVKTMLVTFTIKVPRKVNGHGRHTSYISASTTTASIVVTPGGYNVTAPCTSGSCTIQVPAPLGNDTFTLTLLDSAGTPNVLSTGTIVQNIIEGNANTLPVTFDGVPSSITLGFVPTTLTIGAPGSAVLTIHVLDADLNEIVNQPGNFATSIALTESPTLDPSLTLSGTGPFTAIPATSTQITVSYSGAVIPPATYAFQAAAGAINASAPLTMVTPTPSPTPTPPPPLNIYELVAGQANFCAIGVDTPMAAVCGYSSSPGGPATSFTARVGTPVIFWAPVAQAACAALIGGSFAGSPSGCTIFLGTNLSLAPNWSTGAISMGANTSLSPLPLAGAPSTVYFGDSNFYSGPPSTVSTTTGNVGSYIVITP